jgi:hypothetical protein
MLAQAAQRALLIRKRPKKVKRRILLTRPFLVSCSLSARQQESWLGNLAPIARSIQRERGFPMEFASRGKLDVEEWRGRGRDEVAGALSYYPKPVPLDIKVQSIVKRDGYEVRIISFAGSAHYRVPAYLLVPTGGTGPYPAVVALHDHGGWFVRGKEKLVRMEGEHPALASFRRQYYGGRARAERSWRGSLTAPTF